MGRHYKGPKSYARALDAFVKLMRAADSVESVADRMTLWPGDVTHTQFAVLEALYHVGPMCLTDLARKVLRTSGNLTMVVQNLEKRALVEREQSAEDRRFVRVALTEQGRKLIGNMFPGHAARIAEIMKALTPSEQETLAALCRKLGRAAEEFQP